MFRKSASIVLYEHSVISNSQVFVTASGNVKFMEESKYVSLQLREGQMIMDLIC